MAKAAKAPAKKTSPLVWVGLVALCGIVYTTLGSGGDTPVAATHKARKSSSKDMGVITQADLDAQKHPFPPATAAAVDAFNPAVKGIIKQPVKLAVLPPAGTAKQIDPAFTGGEPNWYFTGCPELDGQKQALLENTNTGDSVYVRPGDSFKDSHVASIDVATVVLVGKGGKSLDVPIVAYGDVPGGGKGPALAANAPLTLPAGALSGPIGGRLGVQAATGPASITMSDVTVVPLPGADATNSNVNTGRRRGRRNRNFGDSDNGF